MYHGIDRQAAFIDLLQYLLRTNHVAQRTDGVRTAPRNQIGAFAPSPQPLTDRNHLGVHVETRGTQFNLRREQAIEQNVPAPVVIGRRPGDPLLEQGGRPQTEATGRRDGLAHMVRLRRPLGHHVGRPFGQGIANQEFKLARLVAATRQAGTVVPLEVNLRPTEQLAQARQVFQRCWRMRQAHASKAGQIHDVSLSPY